jgi:hypothetical protein
MKAIIRRRKSIHIQSELLEVEYGQVRITPKRVYVGFTYPRKFDRITGRSLDRFRPRHGDHLLRVIEDDGKVILETEAAKTVKE